MPSLRRPTEQVIRKFLEQQQACDFSYAEVEGTRDQAPAGYASDHRRIELGTGEDTFAAARAAIDDWQMFAVGWVDLYPARPVIEPGTSVAIVFRVAGLWWMSACRIVYVIDEPGPPARYGFAYGTLPGHVERGEERFMVEQDAEGRSWYDLSSFSRPSHPLLWLGYPITRRFQWRFGRHSLAAMKRFVSSR